MLDQKPANWFENWFNTPYYHLLYQNRNLEEAALFLKKLKLKLPIKEDAWVLDLACGKGRHALTLAELEYQVWGTDLSEASILEAKKITNERLNFAIQDMRMVFKPLFFDAVFNLFTSFGYFDDELDDIRVLKAIYENLKPKGFFVFDYLNLNYVLANLKEAEIKVINGVQFSISRSVTEGKILKTISINDKNEQYLFEEKVRAYTPDALKSIVEACGFAILHAFGNYQLDKLAVPSADRVIFVAEKI